MAEQGAGKRKVGKAERRSRSAGKRSRSVGKSERRSTGKRSQHGLEEVPIAQAMGWPW